jgi:D-tyrosyl-tRNA(Tyr) deacylase
MRIVIQRVARAAVEVSEVEVGAIARGLLVLVGIDSSDTAADVTAAAGKVAGLRVFADEAGHMNLSVIDVDGSVLVVSQFTLLGDTRKGRRPSFTRAAPPEIAEPLIDQFVELLRAQDLTVETGEFGAMMQVSLINDGPVTILLEVRDGKVV